MCQYAWIVGLHILSVNPIKILYFGRKGEDFHFIPDPVSSVLQSFVDTLFMKLFYIILYIYFFFKFSIIYTTCTRAGELMEPA